MKFRKHKGISLFIISASLFAAPLLANAADLKIANDTNNDMSVSIGNTCSSQFGVITQHTKKVVAEKDFRDACKANQPHCSLQVFNTANCTGTHIETITLNVNDGIVGLEGGDNDGQGNRYYWEANGFNLYVSNH